MPNTVSPIPPGYHSLTPYLTCRGAAAALDFYKKAFGATEIMRMPGPDGSIGHAEMKIGDSFVFLSDVFPGMSAAPAEGAPPSSSIFLYTNNVDEVFNRAVAEGCKVTMPLADMFWGDRFGKLVDPFGHHWGLAQHVEDVAPEEMKRRSEEWRASMTKAAAAGQS